ncbi:PilZ domain-containing protein [Aquirhabdus parva]|uniref:Pilus assembly protein n=1 Tax=Aquirhabdus parva TaxID=2283318 RepID=A0A345P681_9GAMM|nr:pilus assembly protein [Aquirhabdus parva]
MLPTRAGGIINYPIRDLQTLYSSYMPFVQGGALFVPSNRTFPLGEEVFVVVTLPESTERTPLTGKVVWVTHRTQGTRPAGFALQLAGEEGQKLKILIEKALAGLLNSDRPTYTL